MKSARLFAVLSVATLISAAGKTAHADDREQCVQAADQAQDLRDKGQYRRAREQMLVCSRDVCPGAVKRDCAQWLTELDATAPTITLSAQSGGNDLTNVRVTLDGQPLAEKLDGKPILVDPGEHTFRFETAGFPPKDEKVVVVAGQKNRLLTTQFGGSAPPPPPDNGNGNGGDTGHSEKGPVPIMTYVLGGVGVVGLGVATGFWLSGLGDKSNLEDTCGPKDGKPGFCTQSQVDSARSKLLIGDISGGVGIVALGAAAYFFIARPKAEVKVQTGMNTWTFDVKSLPGGGAGVVSGRF